MLPYFYINLMLFSLFTSLLFLSFSALANAKRSVDAIFSFLFYLLVLLVPFFVFQSDYMGAVHLLVYPGAILIFFTFATLTTDQKGQWRQWFNITKDSSFSLMFGMMIMDAFISYNWCFYIENGFSGSVSPSLVNPYLSDFWKWKSFEESTSLIALGSEIFGKSLLSMSLLGFLLTFAFLASLKFLYGPISLSRKQRSLFPSVGTVSLITSPVFIGGATFHQYFGGDLYITSLFSIFSLGFTVLSLRHYTFIHCFLILEALGVALNLFYIIISAMNDNLDGEVLVLFCVAIAAAETAVGLALFLSLFTRINKNK